MHVQRYRRHRWCVSRRRVYELPTRTLMRRGGIGVGGDGDLLVSSIRDGGPLGVGGALNAVASPVYETVGENPVSPPIQHQSALGRLLRLTSSQPPPPPQTQNLIQQQQQHQQQHQQQLLQQHPQPHVTHHHVRFTESVVSGGDRAGGGGSASSLSSALGLGTLRAGSAPDTESSPTFFFNSLTSGAGTISPAVGSFEINVGPR